MKGSAASAILKWDGQDEEGVSIERVSGVKNEVVDNARRHH